MPATIMHVMMGGVLLAVAAACVDSTHTTELSERRREPKQGILFFSQQGAIERMAGHQTRSDGAIRITNCGNIASCQNPAFSPNEEEIIFTKFLHGYNIGPSEIIRINIPGFHEQIVVPSDEYDHVNVPGSSWKKGIITYASDDSENGRDEIFITDKWGRYVAQITRHKDDSSFVEPTISPDGLKIVFEKDTCPIRSCEENDLNRGSIWVVNLDGTGLKKLIGDSKSDCRLPNWAPGGGKILFQRRDYPLGVDDYPDWDIWTMDEDGSNQKNITASPGYDTDASWSWDGKYIVYSSDFADLEHPNIYIISSSGGQPQRITNSPLNEDGAPSFSPKGQSIAFESHATSDETSVTDIWLIKVKLIQ
jgi:Tol biopolymer transport system component